MGKYQAHVLAEILDGHPDAVSGDDTTAPRVVFTDPQVATAGLTLHAALDQGLDAHAYDVPSSATAGAAFHGTGTPGTARIVVDEQQGVIVGATFTGTEVAEWLHAATIAIVSQTPVELLWQAVPPSPPAARSGSSCSNAAKPASPVPPGRFPPSARPPRAQSSRPGAARNQWRQPNADRTTFRPSGTRFRPGGTLHVHPQRTGPPSAGAAVGQGTART